MFNHAFSRTAIAVAVLAASSTYALPDIPVFLKESVPPNILLTLDDSGSMNAAYVPDYERDALPIVGATNRFLAASFNRLAYNPDVTYVAPPTPRADGSRYTTSFNAAYLDGLLQIHAATGAIDLSTNYRPTRNYNAGANTFTAAGTAAAGAAYYYIFDATLGGCVVANRATSDDCYRRVTVSATSGRGGSDERQNFANWFSFYRVRHLLMKSSLLVALSEVDPQLRFAWQALNSCQGDWTGAATCGANVLPNAPPSPVRGVFFVNKMAPLVDRGRAPAVQGAHREALFNWITRIPSSGNTPLRPAFGRAGDYFRRTDGSSPWREKPADNDAGGLNACRLSYHVALTDGLWNSSGTLLRPPGNADGTGVALPDGISYAPRAPYADANVSSIADYAFAQWANDLQGGIANTSPSFSSVGNTTPSNTWPAVEYWDPRNNPATWQHLTTFTIGLGLDTTLTNPQWQGGTFKNDATGLLGYQQFASGTVWPRTGDNVTDGSNVYDLWHAAINGRGQFYSANTPDDVYRAFQELLARITARSGSAGNVASASAYVFSNSLAYQSSFKSGEWSGTVRATSILPNGSIGPERWSTDASIPLGPRDYLYTRQLKTVANPNPPVIKLDWSVMNADTRAAFRSQNIVNWLRGDQSKEQGNAACTADCNLRRRTRLLGDILGSAPVVSSTQDFGYKSATWSGGGKPYFDYLAQKATKTPIVLVGANDGFVHVFNGDTGTPLYGYMPQASISKAWRLSEPVYVKKPFVDGPITIGDAYVGGSWRTYAVGTLGAGGKGAYALDITNPTAPTAAWDFAATNSGYTLSRPLISRLPNGVWAAIFSGGYENQANSSALYVVNLETGALISEIAVPIGETNACGSAALGKRGLGAPRAFTTKDGFFYVYAGDLHGNLWRFEYAAASGGLSASFGAKPMFKACAGNAPQPITAAPTVTSLGIDPFVYFGTGRLFDTGDTTLATTNSVYGIIDDRVARTGGRDTILGNQTISNVSTTARLVSSNDVNLVQKRGWYIDLPTASERVIASPLILDQRIYFNTLIPALDSCESRGASWLFSVDSLTGGAIPTPQLDLNSDGQFTDADKVGPTGSKVAPSAIAIAATTSGITAITTSDAAETGRGQTRGAGTCGGGNIRLLGASVYEADFAKNCTPGGTFRTGWRQIR